MESKAALWRYLAACAATGAWLVFLLVAGQQFELPWLSQRLVAVHTLTEFVAVAIAFMVVTAAWHTFDQRPDRSGGVLIAGFLAVGVCDLMHLMTYPGMPEFLTPSDASRSVFFSLVGRTLEAATVAAIGLRWSLSMSRAKAAAMGAVLAMALASLGTWGVLSFPATVSEGTLTVFERLWEAVLCLCNLVLAGALLRRGLQSGATQPMLLSLASVSMAFGGGLFLAHPQPSEFQTLAWHVFKVVAYVMLYRAAYLSALMSPYRALRSSEEQRKEGQVRLQTLGANLPNMVVYQLALGADGSRKFSEVSDSIERVCGLTAAAVEADASLWYAQIFPEDIALFATAESRSLETSQPFEQVARFRVADGRVRTMRVVSAPRRLEDGRIIWDGFILDVTQQLEDEAARRAAESQLQDAQRMESVGTLASGIAHDFNNVLASMLGNTAMVLEDARKQGRTEVVEALEQVQSEGRRARHLVRQVLTFSRKQTVEMVPQPLTGVVEENVALLRATIPAGIDVSLQVGDRDLHVLADRLQLGQVIVNLVTNAWAAVSECPDRTGRIEVGLSRTHLAGDTARACNLLPGVYAQLWVADNGCGMDEATQRRVFEPFFTTKPVGEGTGLGLAVTHGIVESHRGAIRLTSQEGQGTRFDVYLPALVRIDTDAPEVLTSSTPSEPSLGVVGAGHGERVLYIDDVEIMALMVERLLTRANYRVTIAKTPDEGLRVFNEDATAFDVLVTDYNMPLKTGLDVIRAVRQVRPDLPVVLTSGFVTDALRSRAAEEGVNVVLEKQNTFEDLGRSLQDALSRATQHGESRAAGVGK